MRTIRIIRLAKASRILVGGLLLLPSLTSCSDEADEQRSSGASIGFNVRTMQGHEDFLPTSSDAPATKSGTSSEPYLFALEGGTSVAGKTLYLHATSADSIATTDSPGGDEEGAHTRAVPVTTATMHPNAGVFASIYPASGTWNGTVPPNYIYDAEVKSSENWTTTYNWPGGTYKVGFFAYAPYRSTGVSISSNTAPGAPVLTYDVPADVLLQPDLLTAQVVDVAGNRNSAVPLAFRHVLTAVRFETGSHLLPGTITRITLKGVYGTASHRIGETTWNGHSNVRNYEQTMAVSTPDPETPGTPITSPPATFMMLPQTLPSGAQIEVVYKDNLTNATRTLTASIAGSVWTMGKTVTYRISTNSITVTPTFVVTPPADFTYQGGSNTYTVKSYLQVTRPGDATVTMPAAWTTEYSTDGGLSWSNTKPAWLTAFTENGAGGTAATAYTATVTAQVNSTPADSHNETLKNAAPVNDGTNTNIYDLSTKGGTALMRTANCYIVNAAGRYRLPLVYGNAVDYVKVPGTGKNTSAYTSTVSGSNMMRYLANHKGYLITNPYIYNNDGCVPAGCKLIWQDEQNLVTNVVLSADHHYLEFNVNLATIKQGNAVVAVYDASNTVMWSWHIWVTDYVLGTGDKTITNHQDKQYTIMPVNLGWCDGEGETYDERTVQVRFKQTGTSAMQTITVKQKGHIIIAELGNNIYYQWGRKDPFWGGREETYGGLNINKTWYDAAGVASTDKPGVAIIYSYNIEYIVAGIKSPNLLVLDSRETHKWLNLWDMNNNTITPNDNFVVKTVYDPSPVGYKVPPINVFTGFTTTGQNTTTVNLSVINASGAFDKGWNLYCNSSKTTTVFFPASDSRWCTGTAGGGLGYMGYAGCCWSATPASSSQKTKFHLHFQFFSSNNDFFYPMNYSEYSNAFSVRPCQESDPR